MTAIITSHPTKTLKHGDTVKFKVGKETYVYSVSESHLHGSAGNSQIFRALGIERKGTFASKAYGYEDHGGDWPEAKGGDFKALTRLVRALYAKIKPATKAEIAAEKAEAAKAAELKRTKNARKAKLSEPVQRVIGLFSEHYELFGCQKTSVIKLVEAMFGEKFAEFIE